MVPTAVLSFAKFVAILRDNKLVDEEKLQQCLQRLAVVNPGTEDAGPLVDLVVERSLLTRFQANLLLQGKSRSLRITSKYRLLDRLGAGGMGLVYLCEHIRMKRLVALKVLPNTQAKEPGNLERFYREAQAVAALKHPNIVQAYDVDTDNGIHYLVMEYIDGITLEKLVSKHGPVSPERAAHYIAQAADGLQHAAERGLIHRDIKPSNLLLDRDGYIKILDMGLARFFDLRSDDITRQFDHHSVIGTADFISPEQALNSHEVDIRADIYSLGCTFYFLLTGKAPYADANVTQKLMLHQSREPAPVEQFIPGIDPSLVGVLGKMMAKRPEDRYSTAREVVNALAPWTEHAIALPTELPSGIRAPGSRISNGSTVNNQATMPDRSSRQAPRPGRTSLTEKITESAIRRMDGLSRWSAVWPFQGKRRRIAVGAGATATLLLIIIVFRALTSNRPVPDPGIELKTDAPAVSVETPIEASETGRAPARSVQPLSAGFGHVRMDTASTRPSVLNGGIRALPTDVLIFSGPEMSSALSTDQPMMTALHAQLVGSPGRTHACRPILPFAVAVGEHAEAPNTLVSVTDKQPRKLEPLPPTAYMTTTDFEGIPVGSNVLVRENATMTVAKTAVNALVSAPINISAAMGGSTLRVDSGAILIAGAKIPTRLAVLGAGTSPLTLDLNGRIGFLTVCVEQNMVKTNDEIVVRARFSNLGNEPLVVSGLAGNVLRLDRDDNENARIVVQGNCFTGTDKLFRVNFNADGGLGVWRGGVQLVDAALSWTGAGRVVEIDRPLTIIRQGELVVLAPEARLQWLGRISGDKLMISGNGQVLLTRRDNDQIGTEVISGTLVLAGRDGTPAGSGSVVVHANGKLMGSAILMKDLDLRGGTVEPGDDEGHPLVCLGKLLLDIGDAQAPVRPEKYCTLRLNVVDSRPRLVVHSKNALIDLANARLQVSLGRDFRPTHDTKVVLIENRSGQRVLNNFVNLPQFGVVKTVDGKWTAKICYDGNGDRGIIGGGLDVMLYDWVATDR